jgi:hypothetical protein
VEGACEHGNNLGVPQNIGKFLSNSTISGFLRRVQLLGVSYDYKIPNS